MKANSKRTANRLRRILINAIPAVDKALVEGRISIEAADIIAKYSPRVQELMLPETLLMTRPPAREKKVVAFTPLAEKEALDAAAHERIAEALRFESVS